MRPHLISIRKIRIKQMDQTIEKMADEKANMMGNQFFGTPHEETKECAVMGLIKNQIIVLDEGRIAGIGNHETLIKSCVPYQEIYYSQKDGKEKSHSQISLCPVANA